MIPEIEKKSIIEIENLQANLLKKQLAYILEHSTFYQKLFKENNLQLEDIQSLEDLQKIRPTTKEDLQLHNDDFLCVQPSEIIDYVTTSGTLGTPVVFGLTDNDLERLAYTECISLACTDSGKDDIFQLTTTLDKRFMAGLAYFLGARKLGAGVVRVGVGALAFQWDTILRVKPTVLVAVPSFLLKLIDFAKKNNINYQNSSIKKAVCIGEPLRKEDFSYNELGKQITAQWDIQLFSTYASTEMGGAFTECSCQKGGHLHPEVMIVEFLDDDNQPVKEGELGEVVVTTLGVEGMPLVRFKTGDLCYHDKTPCKCGRNTLRLGPIVSRKNHLIKYKGTSIYPSAIYEVLNQAKWVTNYVIEVSKNKIDMDDVLVKVGVENKTNDFTQLLDELQHAFRSSIRVTPDIEILTSKEIIGLQFSEMSRKCTTFIDKR